MSIDASLRALGISLPQPTAPVGAFLPFVRTADLLFVSGHIAKKDGRPWVGQLGSTLTLQDGQEAARLTAIDLIGTLRGALGDLERLRRVVKLLVLVNSSPTFTEQHLVANAASRLFQDVFGAAAAHARSAVGVAQLPFGSCVEIELVAEVA
jgi:enamine deaminase RidA (YjgF/YER057c/UK114 family)